MISIFIKEQKRYTQKELSNLFECSIDDMINYIMKLKQYGILKSVEKKYEQLELTDLLTEDIQIEDIKKNDEGYFYVFTFVGVVVAFQRVLKCYPKYIISGNKRTDHLKIILKVLEKYNSKEQVLQLFNENDDYNEFNLLSLMLRLIDDYNENGLYTSSIEIKELNGFGEILWDKTINESFMFIRNNRPYYMELYTKKNVKNNSDYFQRLHETVLSICSREIDNAGLLDLFEIIPVTLSEDDLHVFGEQDDILYNIEKELNSQFNTRKQIVLKMIYCFVAKSKSLSDIDSFSIFGTNSFNQIWEKTCSDVMDNQLQTQLKYLPMSVSKVDEHLKLIQMIEKPKWHGKNDVFTKVAPDTLIPDIVSFQKIGESYRFIIFDAKYYNITLTKTQLTGNPGIGDVTKQYLYQLAFKNLLSDDKIIEVKNVFLVPTEQPTVIDVGRVNMDMLDCLGLESIQIRQVPANDIFLSYLYNDKYDFEKLNL